MMAGFQSQATHQARVPTSVFPSSGLKLIDTANRLVVELERSPRTVLSIRTS
jgi:hypothetical protein